MCRCTPNMRTPFCGKPGCEWPAPAAPAAVSAPRVTTAAELDAKGLDLVRQIVSEISAMEYSGDMRAIACVVIDKDGDLRTLQAFSEGTKLPLLAGCAVLQSNLISDMRSFDKPRDL